MTKMRTECAAALCIVLVIMSSTLSSCAIIGIPLPACTAELCQTKCLDFANNHNVVVKSSHCAKANFCNCEVAPKQRLPLTREVKGLADAEDDN
ncbi:hypothetical protein SORBI_3005G174500 [Sorghum bicolor]|uniref:Bifunctional inhibitor/plant lipid transfer protein/seed storage helical domain-containing protein n=1 Tax=Sorghum bicolor TaxID=4558 RepID=A0A1B6PT59_SORBI|nr:hypothetical protein SORBI_3005G174500 [Sorghum bicolor]